MLDGFRSLVLQALLQGEEGADGAGLGSQGKGA